MARARRSARSVAAGGRIFRLRCRRSAIFKQTTSVFGPSVLPAGNFSTDQERFLPFGTSGWKFSADYQRFCATGRRKHRRLYQFRYFGSPVYLLGTKCDPISTKIGVKRTYWRLRRPNKYTFLFSAGFLLRTRQAPFLRCGQVAETPESLRKSGERRSGRRCREERRVSSGRGERGHPRPR